MLSVLPLLLRIEIYYVWYIVSIAIFKGLKTLLYEESDSSSSLNAAVMIVLLTCSHRITLSNRQN